MMKSENVHLKNVFKYARENFGSEPEYLWNKFPDYAVLRHKSNSKWYAVIMNVSKNKLNIDSKENIDIIDVKCDSLIIGSLLNEKGFFPAYHMNKEKWITVALDGSVPDDEIYHLLNMSYELTKNKK